MNPGNKRFPSFDMVDIGTIRAVVDYVADYNPDIYHVLDRDRLAKYVSTKIKFQERVQKAQLEFHNEIVRIQNEFQKEVLGIIG